MSSPAQTWDWDRLREIARQAGSRIATPEDKIYSEGPSITFVSRAPTPHAGDDPPRQPSTSACDTKRAGVPRRRRHA